MDEGFKSNSRLRDVPMQVDKAIGLCIIQAAESVLVKEDEAAVGDHPGHQTERGQKRGDGHGYRSSSEATDRWRDGAQCSSKCVYVEVYHFT